MTQGESAVGAAPRVPAERDLTLDLTRVSCVVLVVLVHVLFTGVGRAPDGALVIERTVEATAWFGPLSWVLNIMPLFFVVGGFAARVGWTSAQRRGATAADFVRVRLQRLARPALPLFLFFALILGVARLLPLDAGMRAMVDTIAIGVGSPLWFLAAYMLTQALAPLMIRFHERNAWAPIVVLAVLALVVDLFVQRIVTESWGMPRIDLTTWDIGSDLFGLPNVVFVWLLAQQIGFVMADGWFARRRRWQLVGIILVGYALIWALVALVPYATGMLRNQWPPTLLMAILAVIQAAGLTLLKPALAALMRTRVAQGFVFLVGSRLMTTYLWHLPMIMVLTGLELLLPFPMPFPGSALWWWTRPLFLLVVLASVWVLSLWLVRYERVPTGAPRLPGPAPVIIAVVLFVLAPLGITAYGLDAGWALLGAIATAAALWLTRPVKEAP
ncbi:acyltransferase family protein [Microbacterium gorillae]|uniref:acyltransferase family protein n=1 Tax=Microbacterium gorillae TaxID=1231063 RepID=UPI0006943871|nr:acyltransferase family protein [Microbacterium gorillae]